MPPSSQPQPGKPAYFPGLNPLRAYAAVSVIIAHIGINFGDLRVLPSVYWPLDILVIDAQSAVSLFFVLSGFLIGYLLLWERERTATIGVRAFYVRRLLRIWPLYYTIAIVGLFVLPPLIGPDYALWDAPVRSIVLVLLLLPNLVGPLGPLGHLWTIGLEEQFYLVMPWLARSRRLIFATAIIISVKLGLEPIVAAFNNDAMLTLFHSLRFECMAIGVLGAWLYVYQHPALRWIYHPFAQGAAFVAMIALALVDVPVSSVSVFALSLVFLIVIMNAATNDCSPLRVETRLLNYLGSLSYGLYMFHFPIQYLVMFALRAAGIPEGDGYNAILYTVTLSATVGLAAVSYRYFEQPFLRLKTWFSAGQSPR